MYELNAEEMVVFAAVMRTDIEICDEITETMKNVPDTELLESKVSLGKILVSSVKHPTMDVVVMDKSLLASDEHVTLAVIVKTKLKHIKVIKNILINSRARIIFTKTSYEYLYLNVQRMAPEPIMELDERNASI